MEVEVEVNTGASVSIFQKTIQITVVIRKPEGQRPLRKHRHRWEGNITIDLRDIGWEGMNWTGFIWLMLGTTGRVL
jgi:hypothetical protein